MYNYRAWISGRDGGIRTQNFEIPPKRISRAGHSRSVKFSVFRKFLLLWIKTPRFRKKFADLRTTLDNFLLPIRSDCFPNAVQSENSKLSRGISRILPVFGEIIECLCKMFVDLKYINCGKIHVLAISRENRKFCRYYSK